MDAILGADWLGLCATVARDGSVAFPPSSAESRGLLPDPDPSPPTPTPLLGASSISNSQTPVLSPLRSQGG